MAEKWSIERVEDGHLPSSSLRVSETLYEYDEPLIFSGSFGPLRCLFLKISETSGLSTFVATEVSSGVIDHLKGGRISVLGALDSDDYWVLSSDSSSDQIRYWKVQRSELPDRFLPKSGRALYHWLGSAPDSVVQAEGLLSLKFRGPELSDAGMPLGKLKALIDQSYTSMRRLLTPISLLNSRGSTFDIEVAPVKFASLLVSARSPVLNAASILRRDPAADVDKIEGEFYEKANVLSKKLQEYSEVRGTNQFNERYATENLHFLLSILDLLPDEGGFLSSTEINARGSNGVSIVSFDKDQASEVREIISIATDKTVEEVGLVGGFIQKSQTVRLRSARGKEVTCWFRSGDFDALTEEPGFRKGARIKLSGKLTIRPRIDYMRVESYSLLG